MSDTRAALRRLHDLPEAEMAAVLLGAYQPGSAAQTRIATAAATLVQALRQHKTRSSADALMREYDLSSEEGLTLMELAEALLRIPDAATRDLLIRDKIGDTGADWARHRGASASRLVNVATLGLGFALGLAQRRKRARAAGPAPRRSHHAGRAVGAAMRQMGGTVRLRRNDRDGACPRAQGAGKSFFLRHAGRRRAHR